MLTAGWRRPTDPGARPGAVGSHCAVLQALLRLGARPMETNDTETVIPSHHCFLVSGWRKESQDGEVTQAVDLCRTRLYKALARRPHRFFEK